MLRRSLARISVRTLIAAAAAVTALVAVSPTQAHAGGTRTFKVADFDDLDKGEVDGAAIEASGRVTTGYLPAGVEVPGSTAFSCLARGKELWVGTADKATIQRVKTTGIKAAPSKDKKGKKGKKAKARKSEAVATLEGVVVSAMTELPGGDVIAATLPGGQLWRVTRRGKVSKFAKLDVDQVWAMKVHGGRLLVATGSKGELYSLALSGKDPKVVLDVDEKDLLSMAVVGGQVVVGTAPRAKLFAVSKKLEGVLLHDFSGDEVRAIAAGRTGLTVAVNAFADRKLTSLDALTKTLNRTSLVGQAPSGSARVKGRTPKAEASVYHVNLGAKLDVDRASEATWEKWLERDKQYFTSLIAEGDTVLVSSSADGKIYRVRGPRDRATVADFDERIVTGLCRVGKSGVFATTGGTAGAYQLRAAPAAKARYRSKVFDAKQPASFGTLLVRGDTPLRVRARSGPTDEPDDRWTSWRPVAVKRHADGLRGALDKVEHRRYVQIEVGLGSAKAELREFELFYAPENLAPVLTEVLFKQPKFDADDDDEPDSKATIKWKVDARDDDDLVYEVRMRPEGGGKDEWIRLTQDDKLVTKKELKVDLTTLPDGVYEVEVTASDEPSNGSGAARKDGMVSPPFVVDRRRPEVRGVVVTGDRVKATASDGGGYIHDVSYSIDGGPFRAASATDGVFDGPSETFELRLPGDLSKGRHRVVLRARDGAGNLGSFAVIVKR